MPPSTAHGASALSTAQRKRPWLAVRAHLHHPLLKHEVVASVAVPHAQPRLARLGILARRHLQGGAQDAGMSGKAGRWAGLYSQQMAASTRCQKLEGMCTVGKP